MENEITVTEPKVDETSVIDALDSIRRIMLIEIELIGLEASLLKEEEREAFAAKEKENFLKKVRRTFLHDVISKMAEDRKPTWSRVETAFPERFPAGNESVKSNLCPPGMVEMEGICVLIGRPVSA
jgi:hypothetical protein